MRQTVTVTPPKPPTPDELNRAVDNRLDARQMWLAIWSVAIVALIVCVNGLLVWAGSYPDSFREVSTLSVTGILAAAGAQSRPR